MQSGYRNKNYPLVLADGTRVNLILYKREPNMAQTIHDANRIGNFLHSRGFPARHTYDSRILRLTPPPREQYAGLYTYLEGETIPWEAYTMKHLKSLGASMSTMHSFLARQPQLNLSLATEQYHALAARMADYFATTPVRNAIGSKLNITYDLSLLDSSRELLHSLANAPEQQPLHLDFVRSNILFIPGTSEISGIIDFEKSAFGHPVLDIARTLAFLLVDCSYKTESQIRKYFLYSGYNKRGIASYSPISLSTASGPVDALEALLDLFLFYDFYKFLRHNPYESLRENHHFTRTHEILLRRGVLATTIPSASL